MEAAIIMTCCVLFIQMGLSDAIQSKLHIRLRILSCPKCLTFWSCMGWFALHGDFSIRTVAASFIASYCSLWLALLYDGLAVAYNYLYEEISKTSGSSEDAQDAGPGKGRNAQADEVPQMH